MHDRRHPPPPHLVAAVVGAVVLALIVLLLAAGSAGAARDHVVLSGGFVVPRGQETGTIVVADGPVVVAGRVRGDVLAFSGRITITGSVTGSVTGVGERVVLGPRAVVGGDVRSGEGTPAVPPGARVDGEVTDEGWSDVLRGDPGPLPRLAWWLAVTFSTLAAGLLILWVAPRALPAAERALRERPGPAAGWGVVVAAAVPAAGVLALITLVGIPFGIGLLLLLVPLYVTGYVAGALALGRRLLAGRSQPAGVVLALLAGLGLLRLVALVPVVGALVGLVATVAGLGGLVLATWAARGTGTAAPAVPPTPTGGPVPPAPAAP